MSLLRGEQNDRVRLSSQQSLVWWRIALAVVAAGAMWILAMLCVAVFLVAPMSGFNEGEPGPGRWSPVGLASLSAAIVLFFGSGPAAAQIGRTRWLLVAPMAGLAAWGVGVWIAALT